MNQKSPLYQTIRCQCGNKIGEVCGQFRLKCRKKKMHNDKHVIVQGYTYQDKVVIEGITPEVLLP